MTDRDEIVEYMRRYDERLFETGKTNKVAIFDALERAGIDFVSVAFDGEGDSGQIENIVARKADAQIPLPELIVTIHAASWTDDEVAVGNMCLADAISRLCYDFLEHDFCGWENNDGAYGEFLLTVADRSIHLVFNGRCRDVHTTTKTF